MRWRVSFGVTLTLAMAMGTFTQHILGVLGPLIMEDLEISRATLGALTTAFFAAAALCSPIAGPLVDRLGGHRLLVALFVITGIAFAWIATAPSLWWMLPALGLAGAGCAAINPVTNQLIATRIEPGRQGIITGVKQSGVQAGAVIAGVGLPPLALAIGWRGAMAVVAFASFAALATTRVARAPRVPGSVPDGAGTSGPLTAFVAWLAAYAFLMGAGMSGFAAYLPLYAVEALDYGVTTAGFAAALVGLVGVIARVLWARHAESLACPERPLAVMALLAACAQGLLWSAPAAGTWLLWPAVVGLGASAGAWNAVAMLAIVRHFQLVGTGRASGVVLTGFHTGLTVAPIAVGASVDASGSYGPAWAAVTALFAVAAALAWKWSRGR